MCEKRRLQCRVSDSADMFACRGLTTASPSPTHCHGEAACHLLVIVALLPACRYQLWPDAIA